MAFSDRAKDFLALVSRPGRYIGGEINSIKKDLSSISLKFGLAFPDVYEVGMSHLGMQILYQILNSRADIACERVFSPWIDMEKLLRDKGLPLATLESGIPLGELDVLGFSIQYELSYTNILNILDLGNIPLYSKNRDETHPLIIGGGPVVFNPEPIADFFDIFVLGDGEEVVLEIADVVIDWKVHKWKRGDLLRRLAQIEAVYVPSFFDFKYNTDGTIKEIIPLLNDYECVNKRIVADINTLPLPIRPVVPFPQIVHDHLTVEINRGCTRGCRFCQAGMIYRPNRERSPENIIKIIEEELKNTGYGEVSFLSLSSGDYSCIQDVLINFMDRFADKKIAVSLPSMRVGTLKQGLIEEIKRVRKTGFTMAPEAGSERLRHVINKVVSEDALIEAAGNAFDMGWRAIKLYYMIGLPTETINDIMGIIELSGRVYEAGKSHGQRPVVNVSVSQFIPKPHTPFQWEPQIKTEECLERQTFLRKELKRRRLDFKWHDAGMSFIEGVFSRGDRRLSGIIMTAFEAGCRFDGWGEQFRFDIWEMVFKDLRIDPEFYTYRRRGRDEVFPWGHLNTRVDKEFLYKEYERSLLLEDTVDCKTDKCSACGICDHKVIKNISFYERQAIGNRPEVKPITHCPSPIFKVSLAFSKTGQMKYLGHLELVTLFFRAIRRADIPIVYSAGFHPLPKIVFSQPLPVGIESIAEEAVMELTEHIKPDEIRKRLNMALPDGIKILEARDIPLKLHPLSAIITETTYLISAAADLSASLTLFTGNPTECRAAQLQGLINRVLEKDEIIIHQQREEKKRSINIRPLIKKLFLADDNVTIQLTLDRGERGSVRPYEVIAYLFGISLNDSRLFQILKIKGEGKTITQITKADYTDKEKVGFSKSV
ncbi:MAG TPA: TIGR03960 family B12-binding radical SAM protein [Thermodesulfobacteriota bacterium]|nr:TIGR03960 family B12-binding radical SAM protein [Thermodesulfobacteriota bacterium]